MDRTIVIVFLCATIISCSKKEERSLSGSDSILSKPLTENVQEAQPKADTTNGLLVDQSRFYTPEQQALLNRFSPMQIVKIYHDFKPIRQQGITQDQIDSFIKSKKISLDELKAILQEGDKRGWNNSAK